MIFKVVLLITLFAFAAADSQIIVDCYQCNPNYVCETFSGGGFNGKPYSTNYASCGAIGPFPITMDFTCGSDCSDGCLITVTLPGVIPVSTCSNSIDGQVLVTQLDLVYSLQQGYNAQYDWCSCGLSTALIIVIVVAALIVIGLIVFGIRKCRGKTRRANDYSQMTS